MHTAILYRVFATEPGCIPKEVGWEIHHGGVVTKIDHARVAHCSQEFPSHYEREEACRFERVAKSAEPEALPFQ